MIATLFKSARRKPAPAPASVPEGERVYAIGDVHGCSDLLTDLMARIDADDAKRGTAQTSIVFLGDLVDRGPDSAGVIETAMRLKAEGRRVRFLAGNHEEVFVKAASGDEKSTRFFVRMGGRETILSYPIDAYDYDTLEYGDLAERLKTLIPRDHVEFVESFEDMVEIGDYVFVHAGIRPGRALDAQRKSDLRWIRDEFLDDERDHGKVVIHGHTICEEVDHYDNRIGIDTGAYATGRLTAIGLEGTRRWFLATEGEAHPEYRGAGTRG